MRVENPLLPGTPDVNCTKGWIELKQCDKWPGGDASLRVKHFTPQQKVWLRRRWQHDQRAWLLLHCQNDFILLNGDVAAKMLGSSNRQELISASTGHWVDILPKEELQKCLA